MSVTFSSNVSAVVLDTHGVRAEARVRAARPARRTVQPRGTLETATTPVSPFRKKGQVTQVRRGRGDRTELIAEPDDPGALDRARSLVRIVKECQCLVTVPVTVSLRLSG